MSLPFNSPPKPPESQEARVSHSEAMQRTSALLQSADFAWFVEHGLGGKIKEAQAKALDIKLTPAERDQSVHVHAALLNLKEWVADRHAEAREYVSARS